jgi:L-lactate dehydrogenase (cytochrome)/(S)-mandelate dehydrogenase
MYPWRGRELIGTLLDRAMDAGFTTLVITVDVTTIGNRESEKRTGMASPPVLTPRRLLDGAIRPRWWYAFLRHRRFGIRNLMSDSSVAGAIRSVEVLRDMAMPAFSWADAMWARERWRGPALIKGILDAQDAERAVDAGFDGIIVSNHGGRQLDHALASVDALPAVSQAVGGRGTVLLDGGIRRGTDVIKAMCLGATAVLIGRPFLYGLAARGAAGVVGVLDLLHAEIDRGLTLMGVQSIAELDESWLTQVNQLVTRETYGQ